MIDLDSLESSSSSEEALYLQIGLLLLHSKISYLQWRDCIKAFSYYRYVLPDERVLNPILMDVLFDLHKKNAKHLLLFVLLSGHIETHFTEIEQTKLLTLLISAKNIYRNPLTR